MIALAYEYDSSTVFYSDIQRASLNAVHFNGSDHRVLLPRECPLSVVCGGGAGGKQLTDCIMWFILHRV